jgi:hypothetical protein
MPIREAALLLALALASAAVSAGKVERAAITDPEVIATVPSKVLRIGRITHAQERDGALFVAGEDGVAAIDDAGKPQWAARLPHATVRLIDADGSQVAFVAFDLDLAAEPGGLQTFFEGGYADQPKTSNIRVGLLDKGRRGAIAWTTTLDGASRPSPPTLGGARVAVSDGWTLALLDRVDGKLVGRPDTHMRLPIMQFVGEAMTRNRPAFLDDAFYGAFFSELSRVDAASGKEQWRKANHGLLSAFINITAGPQLAWDGKIVFGNSNDEGRKNINDTGLKLSRKSKVFVANANGDGVWNAAVDDDDSGIGSIAVHGDHLYVATNFTLSAFDSRGKRLWDATTADKDGALIDSRQRGVRYLRSGGGALWSNALLAHRPGPGNCLAADDRFVYLSSMEHSARPSDFWANAAGYAGAKKAYSSGRELVTVLDAATGKYVASLDAKGGILELLAIGGAIVVVGPDDVRWLKRLQ